jgi:glucosyl-3-phosphoglycerate synthase
MVFKQERFTVDFGEISDDIITESYDYMRDHAIYLFLPATYEDATNQEVATNIISKIKNVQEKAENSIDQIVLGLDSAPEKKQFDEIKEMFSDVPNSKVVWNDSPEIQKLYEEFKKQGLPVDNGKGRNMWTGLGYRYMTDRTSSFVIHDFDIKPEFYSEKFLMSLVTPILHPEFGEQDFTKAYYTRITPDNDGFKLSGRTTRLLMYPFLDAIHENYGKHSKSIIDYVDLLRSFKYPLSGEFAMRSNLANSMTIQPDWGLEIGTLNSLHRTRYNLAQVNLGNYDHKHSELGKDNPESGLSRMATEIVKTIYRKLSSLTETDIIDDIEFKRTMYDYNKFAEDIIHKYKLISKTSGLNYDEAQEIVTKNSFMDAIKRGYDIFKKDREELQSLPTWNTISREQRKRLLEIVNKYN